MFKLSVKKKGIDKKKIEGHIRGILEALGEDPDREGLIDTPKRVANMYEEVFEGIGYSNQDIADLFGVTFEEEDIYTEEHKDMVLMKDIELFSYCEHHLAMMYNMKATIAYLPNKRVLGLSKIARIAEMAAKRLQLQENITYLPLGKTQFTSCPSLYPTIPFKGCLYFIALKVFRCT